MRQIILILAILAQLLFGYLYYTSSCKCCATDGGSSAISKIAEKAGAGAAVTAAANEVKKAVTNTTGPLMYKWSDDSAIKGDGWEAKRKSLVDGLKDNQVLEITGHYRADEKNDTNFENLGIARATAAANLLKPPLTDDRIRLVSRLTTDQVDKDNPFVSATFANRINTNNIKETDDKTIIRFPFNSDNKLNDKEVEAYLNDVADRVKKSGERVTLVGHTDSIGPTDSNITLGQKRANIIKRYLIRRGVDAGKIVATSKGEANPIADNKTKAGRAENRRTELRIIK